MHPYQVERQTENVLVFGDTAKPVLSRVELQIVNGRKGTISLKSCRLKGGGGGGKERRGGRRVWTFITKGLTVHVHCRPELSRGGTAGWSCSTDH